MKKIFLLFLVLILVGAIFYLWQKKKETNLKSDSQATETIENKTAIFPQKPPEEEIDPKKFYCPILLYHHIKKVTPQNSYYVSPEVFESQMRWLKDNGYHVVSFDKLYQAAIGKGTLPAKPVVITFDDSLLDQYTNAYPILKKYGFSATFFVKLNNVSNRGSTALTFDEIKEMADNGMIIGSHSMNHDNMANMDKETLAYEISESKKILERNTDVKIKYFSYPGGAYSETTIAYLKNSGYLAAVATRHKVYQEIKTPNSIYQISRIHIDDEMPTFINWVQGKNLH